MGFFGGGVAVAGPHASSHENGGSDEIDATGLDGTGGGGGGATQVEGSGTGRIVFDTTQTVIYSPESWNVGGGGAVVVNDTGVRLEALHTPADHSLLGLSWTLGTDALQVYLNEKNDHTVQMHMGSTGAIDFVFLERDADYHYMFKHADGGNAIPSLGMIPWFTSAPHSGVEQESESYYDATLHRNRTWDGTSWVDFTAADPGDIPVPATATAQDVAEKLNDLMAAMRTAGGLV